MKHPELAAGRVQSWGVQIIDLPSGAAAVGAEPAAVRAALDAALTTERQRWVAHYSAAVAAEQGAVATYL